MDATQLSSWFSRKVKLVDEIVANYPSVSEYDLEAKYDAMIILSCAISAFAAVLWPGHHIDRKRFVELLIRFSPANFHVDYIGVPLLIEGYRDNDEIDNALKVRTLFPINDVPENTLFCGDEIDRLDKQLKLDLPNLQVDLMTLRKYSYANRIYEDIRCGLIHEYQISRKFGSPISSSKRIDVPCYVNWVIPAEKGIIEQYSKEKEISFNKAAEIINKRRRTIHFPYEYIRDIYNSTASNVFDFWNHSDTWIMDKSKKWWIEG